MMPEPQIQLKQRIARQFSQAAIRYDRLADVQWHIGVDAVNAMPDTQGLVLDIGCGTGRITQLLARRCEQVIGMDLAEGMARFAAQAHANSAHFVVADAEQLPLADNSLDGVFSSMALQWCLPLTQVFKELARVLKPGAKGLLTIMVDGSLKELHQGWQAIGEPAHANRFCSSQHLLESAHKAGLFCTIEEKLYQTWHNNLHEALHSIKDIGAGVVLNGAKTRLSRQTLAHLDRYYQNEFAINGQLPISYQVAFLEIQK
ncbi:methyltransferase domain-containing protein [Bowmanella yangjiangensis]|uniref:Methyltransferase domain-containing protein n=1 Tax=Bowmanella yangjiangensis TaxID=2811230 RepID=A0ABS3CVY2_9ALTE|nr:methyltransferase domain-containing protein [Bowmanella yangjiangensis]MBN7820679.1 methyltransferase domain-containing protein [Bowmanella yangjiangensis]